MKSIKFKFKPGDLVQTRMGAQGIVEELRYREGSIPVYAVWHDKAEYVSYSEDQLLPKVICQGDKI